MGQYYRVMAPGDPERPDRPEYNVYRAGAKGLGRGRSAKQGPVEGGESAGAGDGKGAKDDAPQQGAGYTVYKARRGFKRPGAPNLGGLRERFRGGGDGTAGESTRWRKGLRWALIAAGAWLLLSVVLFAVSAQIQKSKLDGQAADMLGGFPLLVAKGETILVIGTDVRPVGVPDENGDPTEKKCVDAAASGSPHPSSCLGTRADTLMLVRAGGGAFQKLSIPRDTYAEIPGQSAQKINAAYSFGGAALQIRTVEQFLGINIDHVVILDFQGFADFIDSIGGVDVTLPDRVHSVIAGGGANGGVTLKLDRGDNHLNGTQALALARTRENRANPAEDDTDRARRQQLILAGIKNRLTSPWRAPINFLRGPLIAWNMPKAMISDMGAFTLPQLALSVAIGGDSGTKILNPSGQTGNGELIVAQRQCRRAVADFLGDAGPRPPKCSPAG